MTRQLQIIDDGIFTISNIFSPRECIDLIARAESIGFDAASVRTAHGPQMMTHIRNNDRVVIHDPALADLMWRRAQPLLPILDRCVACGVDASLRFYRYSPGQQFKRHRDGAVTNDAGHTSKLSYLIYLNDDCQGGATTFRDHRDVNGAWQKEEFTITPSIGAALLFRHARWHEGALVTMGFKYVLRTDVFYTSDSAS